MFTTFIVSTFFTIYNLIYETNWSFCYFLIYQFTLQQILAHLPDLAKLQRSTKNETSYLEREENPSRETPDNGKTNVKSLLKVSTGTHNKLVKRM